MLGLRCDKVQKPWNLRLKCWSTIFSLKKKQKQDMIYGCYTHFQSQHVHKGRTWFSGKCAALVIQ